MAERPVILAIEGHSPLRRALGMSLTTHGYRVIEAATGHEGLSLATRHVPEAIVLDLELPDCDGHEIVRRLRAWSDAPILAVSTRRSERDAIVALDAGADDYLIRPFGLDELAARIRAVLRRVRRKACDSMGTIEVGPLRIDIDARQIRLGGNDVRLSPTEFTLLVYLARNRGKVVLHRQIIEAVWGASTPRGRNDLHVYIRRLRRKLEATGISLFRNEPGVGYLLAAAD